MTKLISKRHLVLFIAASLLGTSVWATAEMPVEYGDVAEVLSGPATAKRSLLEAVTPHAVRVAGGVGAILAHDVAADITLISTVQHLFQRNPPAPVDDVRFETSKTGDGKDYVSEAGYGAKAIVTGVASAQAGETVIAIGFPEASMKYSVGEIMTDSEIVELQRKQKIQAADLLYNPEVEYFVRGQSYQGMSGGPVFNTRGEWIGELIRGGDYFNIITAKVELTYFRVLKASYIVRSFERKALEAPPAEKEKLLLFTPYINELKTKLETL